jgi:hypothetical protein
MLAAWFESLTKTDFVIVTYRGGANVLTDLRRTVLSIG